MDVRTFAEWMLRVLDAEEGSQDWKNLQWTLEQDVGKYIESFEQELAEAGKRPVYLKIAWWRVAAVINDVIGYLRVLRTKPGYDAPTWGSQPDNTARRFFAEVVNSVWHRCEFEYDSLAEHLDQMGLPAVQ